MHASPKHEGIARNPGVVMLSSKTTLSRNRSYVSVLGESKGALALKERLDRLSLKRGGWNELAPIIYYAVHGS